MLWVKRLEGFPAKAMFWKELSFFLLQPGIERFLAGALADSRRGSKPDIERQRHGDLRRFPGVVPCTELHIVFLLQLAAISLRIWGLGICSRINVVDEFGHVALFLHVASYLDLIIIFLTEPLD
ncbi:hypothetical protein SLA2020_180950 [Shorea laevis]